MGQPYVTGPVALYCGTGPGGAPQVLGYTEQGVRIDTQEEYEPFMNDFAGTRIPLDLQDMGEHALISGNINYDNEAVFYAMSLLRNTGNPAGVANGTYGSAPFGAMGAFMGFEKRAHVLWLLFPYSAKPFYQNPQTGIMEPGRRYPFANVVQNQEATGTRAKVRSMVWHCLRFWNPATLSFTLFDNNLSALPAGVPS